MKTLLLRLMEKVRIEDNGCWVWTGARDANGYGNISIDDKVCSTHRVAYELFVGPIPEGRHLHHKKKEGCTSTSCLNPAHLEVLTPKDHMAEHPREVVLKTHCINGHEFTPENTYQTKGQRHCRICTKEAKKRYHAKLTLEAYHNMTPEEKARRNEVRNARRAGKPRSERDKGWERLNGAPNDNP